MDEDGRRQTAEEQREVYERAGEQIGTPAASVRPDLATDAHEDRERTSDRGDRRRADPEVTVADNAGHVPGGEQRTADAGQEASPGLSEPG